MGCGLRSPNVGRIHLVPQSGLEIEVKTNDPLSNLSGLKQGRSEKRYALDFNPSLGRVVLTIYSIYISR